MNTSYMTPLLKRVPDPAIALIATTLTTLIGYVLHPWVDQANTVMLYLLNVVILAISVGRLSVYLSVVLSVGMFDFFFVPPHFSFAVSNVQYLITFVVMMVTGVLIAGLTANLKIQVALNANGAQQSRQLYILAEALAGVTSVSAAISVVRDFNEKVGLQVKFHLPVNQLSDIHDQVDISILNATIQHGSVVETGGLHSTVGTAMLLPLCTGAACNGIMVVSADRQHGSWPIVHRALLQTVASLLAVTLERLQLEQHASEAKVAMTSERLRSSLLSALSHDLRTPLTSLVGIADTLVMHREKNEADKESLVLALQQQSRAISQMVTNLLDMAKLQAGKVKLHKEWQFLDEVVQSAARLLGQALESHPLQMQTIQDMPLVEFDAVLMERVIGNLLENASKYAESGQRITVSFGDDEQYVWLSVRDIGPGFPGDRLQNLLEMFSRGSSESVTPGVGLGLAIAHAILVAHEGKLQTGNWYDESGRMQGAEVICYLPKGNPPVVCTEEE